MNEEKIPYLVENETRDTFTIYVKGTKPYLELQQKIDKAREYIQKRFEINEYGEYYFTHTFDNSNMKELLEILQGSDNNG